MNARSYKTIVILSARKIAFILIGLSLFMEANTFAQSTPKREFRGVWIATVKNIDYPSQPGLPVDSLQIEWLRMLWRLKSLGFNAVVMQIRPTADALYQTDLAPWSAYLTAQQGSPTNPAFDPLSFWIKTAHDMGFEFHAWLNPYRATFDLDTASLAVNHVFHRHRDWLVRYGTRFYLNPAMPEVRRHLSDVVADIVRRYDIDAIHFDDYFYPYKIPSEVWRDSAEFKRYGLFFDDIEDWRRENVNQLIHQLSDTIKSIKPYVQFGVSPFGVWRNRDRDFNGSDTRAFQTCYDDLYADVRLWLREGWIDYVAPQLYWNIGYELADYEKLLYWWKDFANERNLYIGQGIYKVGNNAVEAWHDPAEVPRQLQLNRSVPICDGSIFYSASQVLRNPLGLADSLQARWFSRRALLPELAHIRMPEPAKPRLRCLKKTEGYPRLRWKLKTVEGYDQPAYYAIYRYEGRSTGDRENIENLLTITTAGSSFEFVDRSAQPGKFYTYAITGINRSHREGLSSNARAILKKEQNFSRRCVKKIKTPS